MQTADHSCGRREDDDGVEETQSLAEEAEGEKWRGRENETDKTL